MMPVRPRGKLLAWYDAKRRKLPWRENPTPYRVWISEIMLQQTQVATVVPYFERFLARFPDIASLARAREGELMKFWAGLGYYSRARNLHRASRELRDRHGGRLPAQPEALLRLPGIGRYTAAAVASLAFGKPEALVDGHVARVFARFFALRGALRERAMEEKLWAIARRSLDAARPGDWNQALMELGARVCLPAPERPLCGECPISRDCAARRRGLVAMLPEPGPAAPPVALAWTALRVERDGKLLLWRRAPEERFLPGHWGLPEARHLPKTRPGRILGTVGHSITHHRIALAVREARWESGPLPPQARWVARGRAESRLVSSLWLKALRTGKDPR